MAAGADGRVSRNRGGNGDARGARVESLTFARLARVAEEHLRPGHEEHRVRDVGCDAAAVSASCPGDSMGTALTVAAGHAALHDDDLLALPRVQHRHACDGRARLERDWIDGVVRADHECYIRVREIIVNLVHLKHDYGQFI